MNLDQSRHACHPASLFLQFLKAMVRLKSGFGELLQVPGTRSAPPKELVVTQSSSGVAGGRLMWHEKDFLVSSNSQLRRSITKYVLASHGNLAIKMILNENEDSLLSKTLPWKVLCSMLWDVPRRMTTVVCVSA
jgi:hypothetical protein